MISSIAATYGFPVFLLAAFQPVWRGTPGAADHPHPYYASIWLDSSGFLVEAAATTTAAEPGYFAPLAEAASSSAVPHEAALLAVRRDERPSDPTRFRPRREDGRGRLAPSISGIPAR
jgi:hypothetical protein